ncbi:MAG TPA: hypothetical protein VK524_20985 [Polyangiaceae bacterium]|nr:hypothetical protein [Polyangiaceae bacterium]
MTFERLLELPSTWTCVWGRFGLHLFQGELCIADMDRLEAVGAELRRARPGKTVELSLVLPSDARLSDAERIRMTQLIRRWEKDRVASATVILAEGLRGSLQRSVLTGLLMVVPPPHPSKVFGTVEEAVAFLFPHVRTLPGCAATQRQLLAAVHESYEAFRTR